MEKTFLIVVWQRNVTQPRIYKLFGLEKPTEAELIALGADIVPARQDEVSIDEVSYSLFRAVSATPLRW